jgi:hypothetical protein
LDSISERLDQDFKNLNLSTYFILKEYMEETCNGSQTSECKGVSKTFESVAPTELTKVKMLATRQVYSGLADFLKGNVPASRELSVALTELETSAMWAIKALTHNQGN